MEKRDLNRVYREETGRLGAQIDRIKSLDVMLPTGAYLKGYSFIEFMVDRVGDPYALIGPDGGIIKVWPGKPPSLSELWEAIELEGKK